MNAINVRYYLYFTSARNRARDTHRLSSSNSLAPRSPHSLFLSIQALYKSVKLVQKLRSAVSLTFEHLADGVKRTTPNDAVDSASSSSVVSNSDVTSIDGIPNTPTTSEDEKRLMDDLKKDLKKVRSKMEQDRIYNSY